MTGGATRRHVDSTPALRALMAAVTGVPVEWGSAPDAIGGHYCEACQIDFEECDRTPGDHDSCPTLCADCRERMGWVCCECADPLPGAVHGLQLCATCQRAAAYDERCDNEYSAEVGR